MPSPPYFRPGAAGQLPRRARLGLAILSLPLGLGAPSALAAELDSPVGRWQLIDDETNAPRGVMEMSLVNGELQGRFVEAILRPGEVPNAVCTKCEGERRNQPMMGMVILWGLRPNGAQWDGGHILDPTKGRTYGAVVRLVDGGRKLRVRGFLGFSLLGRTQTWVRLP